ncbi:SGNH/GDSL hydrolase family protein [Georgenia daeguensis]|uniref:SGNH/GDSL hydrolase family protein n=1 Tax=Georgenia daeguensis TaxID=908355 RepID=A0ABP8EPB6_9MICO
MDRRERRPVPAVAGPTEGTVAGASPGLRLLVVGESTAAGTGAPTHETSFVGHLARELAADGREVTWRAVGRDGARARAVTRDLVPAAAGWDPSHVVVLIGINDLQLAWRPGAWATDVTALLREITATWPRSRVVISGLPDVTAIPAIPEPLRRVLARKARRFGWATERAAAGTGAVYVQVDHLPLTREDFSGDGVHPGPAGYARWARALAPAVRGC